MWRDQQIQFAYQYQQWYAQNQRLPVEKSLNFSNQEFVMVLIPPGRFWMGSLEPDGHSNQQQRKIDIKKPFYICKYEIR